MAAPKTPRLYGVMCFWEYKKPKKRSPDRLWALKETHPLDADGSLIFKSSPEPDRWLYRNTGIEDCDPVPIPGRAVTYCVLLSGVRLVGLHPPEPWPPWLAGDFCHKLKDLPGWAAYLEHGHELYFGTEREARKLLFEETP